MRAEIITIGDELLNGFTVDTNSAWMGQQLIDLGIEVARKMAISDKKQAIYAALDEVIASNTVVLITGGLGPTNDDITKFTLCEYFNTRLVYHDEAYRNAERFVLERGGTMNVLNQSQAQFPESARFVPNNNGTASGMWFEKDGCIIVSLPGVPHEMKQMMTESVLPMLAEHVSKQAIAYRTLLTVGIPESQLAIYLSEWEASLPNGVKLAYLPSPGQVILRLSCMGSDKDILHQTLQQYIDRIPDVVKPQILSYTGESLIEIVSRYLKSKNQTLTTAESCTGGAIASAITAMPGSSEWYVGSVVAYSNAVKSALLNVASQTIAQHGAVSQEVVKEMAEGALKNLASNWSIAVSGVAGPSGGSLEKPVGTVCIAIASQGRCITRRFQFGSNSRDVIIKRTISAALIFLIEELKREQ